LKFLFYSTFMVSGLHPFLRKVLVGMARNVRETADRKDGGALATKTYGHLRQLRVGTGEVTEKMIPSRDIADNLKKRGWSYGYVSALDSQGRTLWIVDAHRDDGKRYIVRADEKLTAFVELESADLCFAGSPKVNHQWSKSEAGRPNNEARNSLPRE
jgi:hypothetical protein